MSDNQEYVALQPIDHLGVRAYNPGDRVPVENVKTHNYEVGVQVALADTKDAKAITSPGSGEQAAPQETGTGGTPPPTPEETPETAKRSPRGRTS